MVRDPSVPVVSHSAFVLSASLSTGSCVSHFSHILRWFPLAGSRPMRAGDVIAHIGVVAGDVLLDQPGLACQGAGVCPCLLSTSGSFALTKTSLRLAGLR